MSGKGERELLRRFQIYFVLSGDDHDTGVRRLRTSDLSMNKRLCDNGNIGSFLLSTPNFVHSVEDLFDDSCSSAVRWVKCIIFICGMTTMAMGDKPRGFSNVLSSKICKPRGSSISLHNGGSPWSKRMAK